MPLFLAFLLVPIIEIALFIQVGGLIGLFPTLLIVVLTAILGTWLVRREGRIALGQVRNSFEQLSDPTEPLAHGAMILLAGALLLTPGFFTDAIGFLLLIPGFRTRAFAYLRSKVTVARFQMGTAPGSGPHRPSGRGQGTGDVIDGDYEDVTPRPPSDRPSGWVEGPK
ncbi:FxsA family protein [Phaeobacter sp. HF9A]|uniref:FxsA family protein n=1 Tax=Phaeobacter sp. HF9A TaxID=2721561 RepID=UPI00142F85F0|nr:FxsA family protein [Phaeobacter sp. HF9A]NIZ11802.1 FxsA family protein [Phaeobacter sp. HF9A]